MVARESYDQIVRGEKSAVNTSMEGIVVDENTRRNIQTVVGAMHEFQRRGDITGQSVQNAQYLHDMLKMNGVISEVKAMV